MNSQQNRTDRDAPSEAHYDERCRIRRHFSRQEHAADAADAEHLRHARRRLHFTEYATAETPPFSEIEPPRLPPEYATEINISSLSSDTLKKAHTPPLHAILTPSPDTLQNRIDTE